MWAGAGGESPRSGAAAVETPLTAWLGRVRQPAARHRLRLAHPSARRHPAPAVGAGDDTGDGADRAAGGARTRGGRARSAAASTQATRHRGLRQDVRRRRPRTPRSLGCSVISSPKSRAGATELPAHTRDALVRCKARMAAQRHQERRREPENGAPPAGQGGRDTFRLPQRSRDAAVERLRASMAAECQETAPVGPGRRQVPRAARAHT